MDFGGFNSAEKTPPWPSFSSVQEISWSCKILVEIHLHQRHFSETLFHRNMHMVESHSTIYMVMFAS